MYEPLENLLRTSSTSSARRLLTRSLTSAALALTVLACSTDTTDTSRDDIAVLPAKARIFATVSASGEVVAIDEATHVVEKTVQVGQGPAIVLATPDEKQLFTANWADNTISAITTDTFVATSIPVAGRPYVITLSHDGRYLYAGINTVNQIAVINVQTHAIERSIDMDELPASLIISPDDRTLYVASLGNLAALATGGKGSLFAVSVETGAIVKPELEVGGAPAWITISPDGKKVYTLNFTTDDITVVDTESWKVSATVSTGPGSQAIIGNVTPDGSRLYVTNHGTAELMGIDTATNQVVQTIKLDGKPVGVSFNKAGTRVYTTDFGQGSLNESPLTGLQYLLTGRYEGTSPGQVRVFDIASGAPVGAAVQTASGTTSVVALDAPTKSNPKL